MRNSSAPDRNDCPVCGAVESLPYTIGEIYDAFEGRRKELVEGGTVYLCPTDDLIPFLKFTRTRENALAPGRVRNRDEKDVAKGQQKWDRLQASISKHGFRVTSPVTFILFKKNRKRCIHQGHHRVGIALEEELRTVPVIFHFVRQKHLQPADTAEE